MCRLPHHPCASRGARSIWKRINREFDTRYDRQSFALVVYVFHVTTLQALDMLAVDILLQQDQTQFASWACLKPDYHASLPKFAEQSMYVCK